MQKGSDIYEISYSDPTGYAFFNINPSSGGNMNITVTKQNYIPYMNLVTVTESGASLSVDPTIALVWESVTINGNNFEGSEEGSRFLKISFQRVLKLFIFRILQSIIFYN